jgi:hypothetical protein
MDNGFTLEVCQRANDPLSLLSIEDVNRVAGSDIFVKVKSMNNMGRDAGV